MPERAVGCDFCSLAPVALKILANSAGTGVASVNPVLNWRRAKQLVGETAREIGILMLVFAPLESAFADRPIESGSMVMIILVSLLVIGWGILMESGE